MARRPDPPSDLTEAQAKIWTDTVASETVEFFNTDALRELLKDYCRHKVTCAALSKQVEAYDAAEPMDPETAKNFDRDHEDARPGIEGGRRPGHKTEAHQSVPLHAESRGDRVEKRRHDQKALGDLSARRPAASATAFGSRPIAASRRRDVGKPVKLRKWQRAEILKIYDNPAGTRRAIISFGRKNGKTALAAFLLLLHLCGPEAKPNSQLFSAAQSRDQAAVLFALAAKMVRMSSDLTNM
jgi:hypothetical protein